MGPTVAMIADYGICLYQPALREEKHGGEGMRIKREWETMETKSTAPSLLATKSWTYLLPFFAITTREQLLYD